jgi:protein O-mannosyl-transferase
VSSRQRKRSKNNSSPPGPTAGGKARIAPSGAISEATMWPWHALLSRRVLLLACVLIVANLAVYGSLTQHDFITYDDPAYVRDNPHVAQGLTSDSTLWAFTTTAQANWHPITWLSHMLDVELFGMKPGAHHLSSLFVHIVNSLLLFAVLYRMTRTLAESAFVAALFAVHPLHVESVAWISERKDVLSTFFWMLTLWAYLEYIRRPTWGRYVGIVAVFLLGLMSKPMLVTLPFVLLLLDIWPLARVSMFGIKAAAAPGFRELAPGKESASAWPLIREKVPLFALAFASSLVTFVVQQRGGAVQTFERAPLTLRVENAAIAYAAYIGKTLWPTRLGLFYEISRTMLPLWHVAGALALLAGISLLTVYQRRRRPYLLIGWLWYLGTLLPVIGLVQVGGQAMADRYTYVPLIGLFIGATWTIGALVRDRGGRFTATVIAGGIAVSAYAIAARIQVGYWKDGVTIWSHTLEVTGDNSRAHNNLGVALASQGRSTEASAHYLEAVRIDPNYSDAQNNVANGLLRRGNASEALVHYLRALGADPNSDEAHNGLGAALAAQGRVDEAVAQIQEAIRLNPDEADFHCNLADLFIRKGNRAEAMRHVQTALSLNPRHEKARQLLSQLTNRTEG